MSKNVKGLRQLQARLENISDDARKEVNLLTEANARELERNAKRIAPVDTGKLFQSIKTEKQKEGDYIIKANATGLAPYAAFVEFGTSKQKAQPYLFPSFFKQVRTFVKDLNLYLDSKFK